jgi:hypothetical protein
MTFEKPIDPELKRIEGTDLSGVRLHGPDFERTIITDGWFLNADFSGDVEGLVINGVEVAPLIEAELDRRSPGRAWLRSDDPRTLGEAWSLLEAKWAATIVRARAMPEAQLHVQVNEEWSFVETLRHLIMATDCWYGRMIEGGPYPYHEWGLAGPFLSEPESLGLDFAATPSFEEVLVVRQERFAKVGAFVRSVAVADLERVCTPPSTPGHPQAPRTVLQCLHVILNEEWEHNRYANRDLDLLENQAV